MNKAYTILLIVLLTNGIAAYAQYTSVRGRFQVSETKGCAPLTLTFTNLEPGECSAGKPCDLDFSIPNNNGFVDGQVTTNSRVITLANPGNYNFRVNYGGQIIDSIAIQVRENISPAFEITACNNNNVRVRVTQNVFQQYVFNFGDGSAEVIRNNITPEAQRSYAAQGTYPISVRGRDLNAADNCSNNTRNFSTYNTLPVLPVNTLLVENQTSIQLGFGTSAGVQLRLQIAVNSNTNFQLLQNILGDGNAATINVNNLNTDNNYYCFRLGSYDPCNNTTNFGPVICSMRFDLSIENAVNRLNWNIPTVGISNYSIQRNANPYISGWPSVGFNDDVPNIECNQPYCYRVTANYTNGARSTSVQRCGVSFNSFTPPSINNLSASITDGTIALTWPAPTNINVTSYNISRSINNSNYTALEQSTSLNYTDNINPLEQNVCYRIEYTEACGNASAQGRVACPIILSGSISNDNQANLSWTAYTGWIGGVDRYQLQKFNSGGQLMATFTITSGTSFTDTSSDPNNQQLTYRVTAIANATGVSNVVSNTIALLKEPNIYFPSAFTPNGDRLNDEFRVFGQFVDTFNMKIFNRWGELVFTTNNINQGWDGNFKGKPQPEGTYAFICDITDEAGRNFKRSGSVVLLRKD